MMTRLVEIAETTDRRIAAITAQRGISVEMPVSLPVSSFEDFSSLESWLVQEDNYSNLVRNIILHCLFYQYF